MDFAYSEKVNELRARMIDFMERYVHPNERTYHEQIAAAGNPFHHAEIVDELKAAGIRNHSRRDILERAKSELVHEMNRSLGRDVFDRFRIPDYTVHASIGILMTRGISGALDEGVDAARIEEHLVSYLTTESAVAVRYDRDATLYAYRTATGLFEREFGRELSVPQSELLHEYVRVSLGGNPAPFERTFERQRVALRTALRARRADEVFSTDAEMAGRLDEAIAVLESLPARPDDESVERMMLYHNLQREIES